jgi:hypothetical protein
MPQTEADRSHPTAPLATCLTWLQAGRPKSTTEEPVSSARPQWRSPAKTGMVDSTCRLLALRRRSRRFGSRLLPTRGSVPQCEHRQALPNQGSGTGVTRYAWQLARHPGHHTGRSVGKRLRKHGLCNMPRYAKKQHGCTVAVSAPASLTRPGDGFSDVKPCSTQRSRREFH